MGFCGFFLVHVGQVILAGWNNFRSMVSGYEIQPAPPTEPFAAAEPPKTDPEPPTPASPLTESPIA
jgi:hypothetical protein